MSITNTNHILAIKLEDCKILETFKKETTSLKYKFRSYYKIQTPFGICIIRTDHYPKKNIDICSALDKTSFFINQANKIHNHTYKYINTEYIANDIDVKIICTLHGEFEQQPHAHLTGKGCYKCGREKTTEILSKSKEWYEEKYLKPSNNEFSIVGEYKNFKTKTKFRHNICKFEFERTPRMHSQGIGCPYCSKSCGWSYTNWEKAGKISKNFDSFKVYIVHCYNKDSSENFIKIGRTFQTTKKRMRKSKKMPYNYTVLKEIIFRDARECCKYEHFLLSKLTEYQYIPHQFFPGHLECFNYQNKDEILKIISK